MKFVSIKKDAVFYDPFNEFKETSRTTDIRIDPLTGKTSRIIYFPVTLPPPPDPTPLAEMTKPFCPFCKPGVYEKTPRFPEEIVPGGRIERGDAIIFPNAFPYDAHSAVTVVGDAHYTPIDAFRPETFANALGASVDYIRHVAAYDDSAVHHSVNMNYMPTAGGSIIHPHIQVIAGDTPTTYQREFTEAARRYRTDEGAFFFDELVNREREEGTRFIDEKDGVTWLSSFAPKGITEFLAVFESKEPLMSLDPRATDAFCLGLVRILGYLGSLNFASFNLAVYSAPAQDSPYPTHARVVPRTTLPPLGASDINYLELLHDEVLTIITPEDAAAGARGFFT
jgi:galactose-1-phosphate uridylyltransferase